MQQAIYNTITIQTTKTATPGGRRTGLGRRVAQTWDLVGVLALIASSAAYGFLALAGVA